MESWLDVLRRIAFVGLLGAFITYPRSCAAKQTHTRGFQLTSPPPLRSGPRCSGAVNVVLMCGSEGALEVRFLHLIRVDYSVPQPCSRQSHTKGGPAPACTAAL